MVSPIPVVESSLTTPRVRTIQIDQPWEWLGAGWKDLWRAPAVSIPYGLLFVVMGYGLVYLVVSRFQYALALTTGFLLAGPFLSMGLYDISRRFGLIRHQPPLGSWKGADPGSCLDGLAT